MVEDTIAKIEEQLRNSRSLSEERRQELMDLVSKLRTEMAELATTHSEEAQSIARFTELSAHEATRQQRNPELIDISVKGLSSSVVGFERSHPKLVQVVNRIAYTLSSLGI
jgi:chromosome segregation ATPase